MVKDREELIKKFIKADMIDIPDFTECIKPLDMALWVLCVAKDKIGEKRLTAEEISFVIVETQEISISIRSVANSLNRASNKVHRYSEKDGVHFEIMKPGREYLSSLRKENMIHAFYFEPDSIAVNPILSADYTSANVEVYYTVQNRERTSRKFEIASKIIDQEGKEVNCSSAI